MRRLLIVIAALAGIGFIPIGTALLLDVWAEHDLPSLRTASIWTRDLLRLTPRERLYWEAAEDPNGATYIRWALRRGVDPNHGFKGWRPIDEVMYNLFGGCTPHLGPFEALARSGVDLDHDRGSEGGLLDFAAEQCRRPDLVRILLDAGADPARAGGSEGVVRRLGSAAHAPDARDLWAWLLDHDRLPCRDLGSSEARASFLERMSAGGLADLAARAEAACAAKGGGD